MTRAWILLFFISGIEDKSKTNIVKTYNDIRNSKVFEIIEQLKEYNIDLSIYDPIVDAKDVLYSHKLVLLDKLNLKVKYDAILVAVAHDFFKEIAIDEWRFAKDKGTIIKFVTVAI